MRCYFNLVHEYETIEDKEGIEVSDPASLEAETISAIKEAVMAGDLIDQVRDWSLQVTDRAGLVAISIPLRRSLRNGQAAF